MVSEHTRDDAERIKTDDAFLQQCLHESLRLHPASPVAWRKASEAFTLPDGTHVEADDNVLIDLMSANIETAIFGEDAHPLIRTEWWLIASRRSVSPLALGFTPVLGAISRADWGREKKLAKHPTMAR